MGPGGSTWALMGRHAKISAYVSYLALTLELHAAPQVKLGQACEVLKRIQRSFPVHIRGAAGESE